MQICSTHTSLPQARRPALQFTWDGSDQDGARGIEYEVRLAASGDPVASGVLANVQAGEFVISTGLLPDTSYEGRLRIVGDWPTDWTGWDSATTPDLRVTTVDLADGAVTRGGIAGSGPTITNNSATWTTVCSFTLTDLPAVSFIQGSLSARWTQQPSDFPSSFVMRVTAGGTVVALFSRAALLLDNLWRHSVPFTLVGAPAGDIDVVFEIQNAGGAGVNNSNLFAMAVLK